MGVTLHVCQPSTQEAEARRVQCQLGLQSCVDGDLKIITLQVLTWFSTMSLPFPWLRKVSPSL